MKEYSFRNKNSSANQVVFKTLHHLKTKSTTKNEMRVNVFKQITLHFPYLLHIIQKDINDTDAVIQINISVKLHKMFFLFILTSIVLGLVLGNLFHSYLVLIPLILKVLLLYYIGKTRVSTFTEKMVEGWFKRDDL